VDQLSRLERRTFVQGAARVSAAVAGLALLNGCGILPFAAKPPKVPRLGYVGESSDEPWVKLLRDRLGELGWVEGQTLAIEWREQAEGENSALIAELVALPVDVLVTVGTPTTTAAKQATNTIPIVFTSVAFPIPAGVVASLARPGGNVTGVSQGASPGVRAKQVEVLGGVVPGLRRVAVIVDAGNPVASALSMAETQAAAGVLGVQVLGLPVGPELDLLSAFTTAASWQADGIIVGSGTATVPPRARVADLAARTHLPAIYALKEFVDAGGLMSYGTSLASMYRQAATFVDKILRGARPADLPVQQLTAVEFAVNVKALQGLGLTLPRDVAVQVTEWVS
jgi:putative ABC transport system substrate-binding protein